MVSLSPFLKMFKDDDEFALDPADLEALTLTLGPSMAH
jgi:hypothetical protein